MDELTIKLDNAVATGCSCIILQDDEYAVLLKEFEERNERLGVVTAGPVAAHALRYRRVYVFPSSRTKQIIRS